VEDKIQNAVSQEKDIKLEEISEAFEIPPPPPPVSKDLKEKKQILKKILVVDDDDDIRKLITKVLKQQKKYTVITASEGQTALQIIRSNPPDMIILDAMLPEVHGFEICKKIKQSSKYTHIPVIMITAIYKGWRFAKDLKESYKVDDFIEKPFRISDLISRVEKIFAKETKPQEQEEKLATEIEEKLRQGIKRYRQGDIQGAINFLQEGIKIDPLAYNLHYHLGLLYGKEGKIYKAIQELEIATKLVPHHFRSLKNLAILYQKAGFRYKAIEMWEQALGNSPDKKTRESIKKHLINLL
jgi:DNA-binding response OmpR family regulator